jgi:anti-sigma regulatory factor (Ser/Thr protein kinase)
MLTYDFFDLTESNIKTYVAHILEDIRCHLSISRDSLLHYSLQLTLWEMLINIVDHSFPKNITYRAYISVTWTEHEITLQITNKHGGFDWETPLSTGLPSPDQTRGRGLYIIKNSSKHFTFDASGQTAYIIFDRI